MALQYYVLTHVAEHPLRQLQLEIPEGAVMVECRFNVSNLVLVNMSESGQPHNVFAGVKERRCERLLTFSHCLFTEESVSLWAVFTNVTVAAARTVFCNQTTIADDTTVDKSFNITLGGTTVAPAPSSAVCFATAGGMSGTTMVTEYFLV